MAGEWEETTLGAEADLLTGFPFKSERYTDSPDSIPLVRGDNIVQGAMRWDGVKRWPISERGQYSMYELSENDVVLAMDRPWIEAGLKYATISKHDLPCLLVQRTARLRGGPNLETKFLRYIIGSREFTQHIHAITTGTAVPHISGKQIKDFKFLLPPLAEQKAIAELLGALDDKIELNRRMNATLEAMARALFQSWFVDFDPVRAKLDGRPPVALDPATAALFPDSFQDSSLGHIPKGWEAAELGQIAHVIDCLHAKKPERCDAGQLYLQLNNIRDDGLIDITDSFFVGAEDYQKWISRMEAVAGDCVITNVGRVGAVGQIPEGVKAALGRNITGIRCKAEFPFPTFLIECLVSESMRGEIRLKTDSGTILDALNVKSIPKLRFVRPTREIGARFEELTRPVRRGMEQNISESRTLATLRDTLLPKLLSGEISPNPTN